jgi:DNA-binding PadR family transcriptional regulator
MPTPVPSHTRIEHLLKRLGEPSWWILATLHPTEPKPALSIVRDVEDRLRGAEYPNARLDPSTLHYALRRMLEDGLVARLPDREVDVPGPHGTTRRELRPVWIITNAGVEMLRHRHRVTEAMRPAFDLRASAPHLGTSRAVAL